jgi:hypothetical protein
VTDDEGVAGASSTIRVLLADDQVRPTTVRMPSVWLEI